MARWPDRTFHEEVRKRLLVLEKVDIPRAQQEVAFWQEATRRDSYNPAESNLLLTQWVAMLGRYEREHNTLKGLLIQVENNMNGPARVRRKSPRATTKRG